MLNPIKHKVRVTNIWFDPKTNSLADSLMERFIEFDSLAEAKAHVAEVNAGNGIYHASRVAPRASVRSFFDGDTLSWGLYYDGEIVIYVWSTNEAIERAAADGAFWPDGKPSLSHIPNANPN